MSTRRLALTIVAVTVPSLVLAAVGVTHPTELDATSAGYWRDLHIGILAVFPLLGFAPWLIVRGRSLVVSWIAGILGFVYAAFYSALDVLAGIGAGGLEHEGMHEAIGTAFHLGDALGLVGSVALVAACVFTGVWSVRTIGLAAIPGALLALVGSLVFLKWHIFFPYGVIGQLLLAAGWAWLVVARHRAGRVAGS